MMFIYSLITACAGSLLWALFDIWQMFQPLRLRKIDPDSDFGLGTGVIPRKPPLGSLDSSVVPEIDGSSISRIP
jgi:hypothetical protein